MTKAQLKKMFTNKSDEFWGIETDEYGATEFPSGHSGVECTGFAVAIREKLGKDRVQVLGFSEEENPSSEIAKIAGGHDFALVADRFIVDPFINEVEDISSQIVFDLHSEGDIKKVERLYGDPEKWKTI